MHVSLFHPFVLLCLVACLACWVPDKTNFLLFVYSDTAVTPGGLPVPYHGQAQYSHQLGVLQQNSAALTPTNSGVCFIRLFIYFSYSKFHFARKLRICVFLNQIFDAHYNSEMSTTKELYNYVAVISSSYV